MQERHLKPKRLKKTTLFNNQTISTEPNGYQKHSIFFRVQQTIFLIFKSEQVTKYN
jgi:hypothetical protein